MNHALIQPFVLKTYGLSIQSLDPITNEMFRCTASEGVFYLRISQYKTLLEQQAELSWIHYLSAANVGVPHVVPSTMNQLVVPFPDAPSYAVVLFHSAPGIHLPRNQWDASVFYALGKQIGRMHEASRTYLASESSPIQHWYESIEYQFLEHIPVQETTVRSIAKQLLDEVQAIPQHCSNYGIIHGDLWLENILVQQHSDNLQVTMIDFQDCEQHYYVKDLVVPIYSAMEYSFYGGQNIRDYVRDITDSLLKGYQLETSLSDETLAQIPTFFRLKEMFEYSLMHMYNDIETMDDEQFRLLNLYRMRIEYRTNDTFL